MVIQVQNKYAEEWEMGCDLTVKSRGTTNDII